MLLYQRKPARVRIFASLACHLCKGVDVLFSFLQSIEIVSGNKKNITPWVLGCIPDSISMTSNKQWWIVFWCATFCQFVTSSTVILHGIHLPAHLIALLIFHAYVQLDMYAIASFKFKVLWLDQYRARLMFEACICTINMTLQACEMI
jgi:hypothetical protein